MLETTKASFTKRLLLATACTLLSMGSPAFSSTDFSGTWVLELRASSPLDAIFKRLGASWIERRFVDSVPLQATYTQTPRLLTIKLRGSGFLRTDIMRIDNKPERKEDSLFGRYTMRTFWSRDETQLVSAISLRTKDSRDGQMTIVRELTDGGKTLILSGTLTITGESNSWTLWRVWRKQISQVADILRLVES
jgi:hypothetical protein